MKRICIILCAACACMIAFAQSRKVESFDKNTWKWIEGTDKYHNVVIEDGYLYVGNLQINKKYTDYQNVAKTYARLPFRPNENFKLTIKYLVADYNSTWYNILFNTDKQCMMDEEETGQFETYLLFMGGSNWGLNLGKYGGSHDILPGKVKAKGEYPMEFVLEKKSKNVTIEINGIQIFEGECQISNPCIGFTVPLVDKKKSYIKIDEVIIEQADRDND